jgi:hypothetical protein
MLSLEGSLQDSNSGVKFRKSLEAEDKEPRKLKVGEKKELMEDLSVLGSVTSGTWQAKCGLSPMPADPW